MARKKKAEALNVETLTAALSEWEAITGLRVPLIAPRILANAPTPEVAAAVLADNPPRLSGDQLAAKLRQERREARMKEKGY